MSGSSFFASQYVEIDECDFAQKIRIIGERFLWMNLGVQ